LSVWVLLEGAGPVGDVSLIVSVIATVLSTLFALTLAFRRVAPTFVIGPLALAAMAGNVYAAFRVWGLRETLFDASSADRAEQLAIAMRESPASMEAGAVAAVGGGLLVLIILGIVELTTKESDAHWTVWHAAPTAIGGLVGAGVATAAGHSLLAGPIAAVGILASVASLRSTSQTERPRTDAWRAVATLCTGLVGIGCVSALFCEELLIIYAGAQSGELVSAESTQDALSALSWRTGALPVTLVFLGAIVSWALSRPNRAAVLGMVAATSFVLGTGATALTAADEMVRTLTVLNATFDDDGLHTIERRLGIDLPRVAEGAPHTARLDITVGRRGVAVADIPIVTIRDRPTGRSFPDAQVRSGILPSVTERLEILLDEAQAAQIHSETTGRVTLWVDEAESWAMCSMVIASILATQRLAVDAAAIVPGEHVTVFPLDHIRVPPTAYLHADGRIEHRVPGDALILEIDPATRFGSVIAVLDDNPGSYFILN
jgi:hypothetical protein